MTSPSLVSVRRRVHAVLAAALIVSVAANVTAAEPTLVGRAVAAWPPLALMLVVDVLGRVPAGATKTINRLRIVAAFCVAGVAAVASFSHMRHVALAAGESQLVAWLFPLTVDGLAVVCSIALVELANRTSIATSEPAPEPVAHVAPSPVVESVSGLGPLAVPLEPVRV